MATVKTRRLHSVFASTREDRRVRKIGGIVYGRPNSYARGSRVKGPSWSRLAGSKFRYKTVAVGGTFDVLHAGHERLLARAFSLGERVLIGVSGDRLAASLRKDHPVNLFKVRVRALKQFLDSKDWLQRARISELQDSFGPAVKRKRLQALVVSTQTSHSAIELNRRRRERGLMPLQIDVVALVRARDGKYVSTSRIRRGEIDAKGNLKRRLI